MSGRFIIEPLAEHDRSGFSCGEPQLDRYLREQASQDVKRLVAGCFVAVEATTNVVVGYYTLAATSLYAGDLPPDILKRLPRYPLLPAAIIGRLAVREDFHRRGLGGAMLANAALRVLNSDVKAIALLVDAKDDKASRFYRHHGFRPFAGRPLSLLLPLGTLKKAASYGRA